MTDAKTPADHQPEPAAAVPLSPPVVARPQPPAAPKPMSSVPPQPVASNVPARSEPVKPADGKTVETKPANVAVPKPTAPPMPSAPSAPAGASVSLSKDPASKEQAPKEHPPKEHPPGQPAPKPPVTVAVPDAPQKSRRLVWLACLGFVLLAACDAYLYYERTQSPDPAQSAAQLTALQADLKAAQQRVAALEQRPLPTPPDTARLVALENTVKALATRPAPDTSALEQRLATLESRPAPIIPDITKDVQTAVAGASAELSARIATLDSKVQQDLARATSLRAAGASLEAGKPVGDLAGAGPALQRFATAAPPTEPGLRQSFAAFAGAAEKASEPSGEGKDFTERMWARAQQLVTVRQGDKVLVGAPAAVALAAARGKLDAGDLAGAVLALGALDPAAAAAMAPWKRDAQALLEARAALAAMATKS